MNKIKSIFFNGMFGLIYISFTIQALWSLYAILVQLPRGGIPEYNLFMWILLPFGWLAIIAARYLSKRSASGNRDQGGYNNYRR
ncbi:MAG: hypothetical protein FWF97_02200 [Alphaproteobacteria bacterium]|nr:hypothetical protein [Alphaproteobacteria bacterium]